MKATVCVDCKHRTGRIYCRANPLIPVISHVTGKVSHHTIPGLALRTVGLGNGLDFCAQHNDGSCELFERSSFGWFWRLFD